MLKLLAESKMRFRAIGIMLSPPQATAALSAVAADA